MSKLDTKSIPSLRLCRSRASIKLEDIVLRYHSCVAYPVLVPVSVGLNLTYFKLLCVQYIGVSHDIKLWPLDLPMVSGVSICTCALFSCIAQLRLVHSCDILHTKFIECIQACFCQV